MRTEPTLRIPLGILALLAALAVYAGVIVWASTLVVGMALRAVSGQGVQPSFVIVAGLFLALFLIGWRVVSGWIARRRGLKG